MKLNLSNARARIGALFDRSAWLLAGLGVLALLLIDPALVGVLVRWSLFAGLLAGVTIIVSRIVFPQIDLSDLVKRTQEGDMPAAVLAAALVVFVGLLFLGVVQWAAR